VPKDNLSDFPCRIHPEGINNDRFVRDSELGAVNGAKSESMPGFELRMGGIVRINHLPLRSIKAYEIAVYALGLGRIW